MVNGWSLPTPLNFDHFHSALFSSGLILVVFGLTGFLFIYPNTSCTVFNWCWPLYPVSGIIVLGCFFMLGGGWQWYKVERSERKMLEGILNDLEKEDISELPTSRGPVSLEATKKEENDESE